MTKAQRYHNEDIYRLSMKERGMLVRLRVHRWPATASSTQVSEEVAAKHGADETRAGRYIKYLLDSKALKEVDQVAVVARHYHKNVTCPWSDTFGRLLPVSLYKDYVKQMDEYVERYQKEVKKLAANYSKLVSASKQRLGTMFVETEYLAESEVVEKFDMTYEFWPVPDSSHVAAQLSEEEQEVVRKGIETEMDKRVRNTVLNLYERVDKALTALVERLDGDDPKVFRDTLVTNIREVVAVIPDLNFTGDRHLSEAAERMDKVLEGIEPDNLRAKNRKYDPAAKESVVETAKSVKAELDSERMGAYIGARK